MRTEYKLIQRADGCQSLVMFRRGIFNVEMWYYYRAIGEWGRQPVWYDTKLDELEQAFDFHCNCGKVRVLKSCGGS